MLSAVSGHDKDINALVLSPDDRLLASASQDKSIKLWGLPSLVLGKTLRGHRRGVWGVAFSPVDKLLVSAAGGGRWGGAGVSCVGVL